jgi:3',5'-cyclic AMP phosphodiesterase CpdA
MFIDLTKLSKRFLKTGMLLSLFCILPAAILDAALTQRYLCKDKGCTVAPDSAAATGVKTELLDFAQTTDIHIVDEGNPLRAEELKIDNKDQTDLGKLLKSISSADRPIGPYSALLWEYAIEDINAANAVKTLDFMIATGDFSDSSIIPEYQLFADLIDGGDIAAPFKSHGDNNNDEPATYIPRKNKGGNIEDGFLVEGLKTDFYATVGNHDVEYMGSFNTDGIIGLLVKEIAYGVDVTEMNYLKDIVNILIYSENSRHFGYRMDDENGDTGKVKGAYTFDPAPFVHCIALNTCEFSYENKSNDRPIENLSLGFLSIEQANWALNDIEANRDKLCIIFAHHGPHWFWPLIRNNSKYYVTGTEFRKSLMAEKNVIAYVNGHTHMNKIRAEYNEDGTGYWDINTSAIIEFPHEWRNITVFDMGNGLGMIRSEMRRLNNVDKNKIPYFEDDGDAVKEGTESDRDVEMYFKMPVEVAQAIISANEQEDTDNQQAESEADSDSDSGGSSGMCFISSSLI